MFFSYTLFTGNIINEVVKCSYTIFENSIITTMVIIIHVMFFFFKKRLTLCVWVFCLHLHMCATCVPGAWGGQMKALDPMPGLTYRLCTIMWVLGLNLGPLKKQQVLLTTQPSLWPPWSFLSLLAVCNTFCELPYI